MGGHTDVEGDKSGLNHGPDRRKLILAGLSLPASLGLDLHVFAKEPCPKSLIGEPLIWNQKDLERQKEILPKPWLEKISLEAELALRRGPYTVTDKMKAAPSGDIQDYTSLAPYWWPDPNKEDGKPYIRRDGVVNPERNSKNFDRMRMQDMMDDVQLLTLAYWFTGRADFAQHAAEFLRAWFVDDKTRMNPNMNYAQSIPGRTEGRGIGIIDTHKMGQVIDATQILARNGLISASIYQSIRVWFSDYTRWLVTSPLGLDEHAAKNNHGTFYDLQLINYSLFAGDCDFAKKCLRDVKTRIDSQISSRGRMPLEEKRTRSLHYYVFNTLAFLKITRLAQHIHVDLTKYKGRRGQSVRKTLLYLSYYYGRDNEWPHEQIGSSSQVNLGRLMIFASALYDDAEIQAVAAKARLELEYDPESLTLPA